MTAARRRCARSSAFAPAIWAKASLSGALPAVVHVAISVSTSRHRLLFRLSLCRQMPVSRHRLLFRLSLCRQMPVSRHGLPFWCSPCRPMRVSRHRLLFGGPPCRQMPVSRHRRRPAVMVGGYCAPLWWALCNGPPRGGRCLVTFRSDACSAVARSLFSSSLTSNRVLGAFQLSTWQRSVAERPFKRPR